MNARKTMSVYLIEVYIICRFLFDRQINPDRSFLLCSTIIQLDSNYYMGPRIVIGLHQIAVVPVAMSSNPQWASQERGS